MLSAVLAMNASRVDRYNSLKDANLGDGSIVIVGKKTVFWGVRCGLQKIEFHLIFRPEV